MAFLQVNMYSTVLGMEVIMNVLLPQKTVKLIGRSSPGNTTDVPVLYLLHGMGGNHSVWERRSNIERYASDLGIAVIMPSTDLGWYTDTQYDMRYWTFLSQELPKICHELFPQLSKKREKTFAAGLSMGGYGALKLGLLQSDQFAAVASLSGPLNIAARVEDLLAIRGKTYWEGVFGPLENFKNSEHDLVFLLQKAIRENQALPKIFLACGEQDPLLHASQDVSAILDEATISHFFETAAGEHDWIFWDQWIQKFLLWLPLNEANK
ncbi:esterase family protein [Enterococcus sp. BWB1-3]|uniref:alpha/beta hydrolase n=1 Tax=unclassified Enterococcus TaxID=2608891 RepID=UPI001922B403|nr:MULTISPECIES: alpha/beta hydrolase family protein [unclassified Enterococcus]MBL1227650.1 esterase family protein [Enterococcus sp. BWB1-3]MCB5954428.1 esterase family protein [Enterococcus sp. CWB-B31]